MLDEIPRILTLSLAGKIAGLSRKAFLRIFVYSDSCSLCPGGGIWTAELEHAIGREFSLVDVHEADAKLQQKRDYMKNYRRRIDATI